MQVSVKVLDALFNASESSNSSFEASTCTILQICFANCVLVITPNIHNSIAFVKFSSCFVMNQTGLEIIYDLKCGNFGLIM